MAIITGSSYSDFVYKRFVKNAYAATAFSTDGSITENLVAGGTVDATTSATELNDAGATFVTDGVEAGHFVVNKTEGITVEVVSVDSETKLTTEAVTDWNADDYEIYINDPTITLIDSAATFISDGVRAGDSVSNDTDAGAACTVVSVDSETQITTTALAGGTINAWLFNDDYTVDTTTAVVRTSFFERVSFIRGIIGFTNGASGTSKLRIYYGNNAADAIFTTSVTQNQLFQIDPDLPATNERVIVEIDSGGSASVNISYEYR